MEQMVTLRTNFSVETLLNASVDANQGQSIALSAVACMAVDGAGTKETLDAQTKLQEEVFLLLARDSALGHVFPLVSPDLLVNHALTKLAPTLYVPGLPLQELDL